MSIFPTYSETFILPAEHSTVIQLLEEVLDAEPLQQFQRQNTDYLFRGKLTDEGFTMMPVTGKTDYFIPVIKGKIEDAKESCIVFVEYQLLAVTKIYLVFWSLVLISLTIYFFLVNINIRNGLIVLLIASVNIAITLVGYRRQVKLSSNVLKRVITV
jgi:hypothetical protein